MPPDFPFQPFPSPQDASYADAVRRVAQRPVYDADAHRAAAAALLGAAGDEAVHAATAPLGLGVLSGHTHYFPGFALVLPVPAGYAVAVRQVPGPSVRAKVSGADTGVPLVDLADEGRVLEGLVTRAGATQKASTGLEIALVRPAFTGCRTAGLTALGTAAVRALTEALNLPWSEAQQIEHVRGVLAAVLNAPFSSALPLASYAGRVGTLSLIDTATGEHLSLALPDTDRLSWSVVAGLDGPMPGPSFFTMRLAEYARTLTLLQAGPFSMLRTARDLEHRDLPQALARLPKTLRPVLRHLVSENRRVPQMVAAVRRPSVHLLGGLLLISQASLRNDWGVQDHWIDTVMAAGQGAEGVYGVRAVDEGRDRCALVVGQPVAVAVFLNRMQTTLQTQSGAQPETMFF